MQRTIQRVLIGLDSNLTSCWVKLLQKWCPHHSKKVSGRGVVCNLSVTRPPVPMFNSSTGTVGLFLQKHSSHMFVPSISVNGIGASGAWKSQYMWLQQSRVVSINSISLSIISSNVCGWPSQSFLSSVKETRAKFYTKRGKKLPILEIACVPSHFGRFIYGNVCQQWVLTLWSA